MELIFTTLLISGLCSYYNRYKWALASLTLGIVGLVSIYLHHFYTKPGGFSMPWLNL